MDKDDWSSEFEKGRDHVRDMFGGDEDEKPRPHPLRRVRRLQDKIIGDRYDYRDYYLPRRREGRRYRRSPSTRDDLKPRRKVSVSRSEDLMERKSDVVGKAQGSKAN